MQSSTRRFFAVLMAIVLATAQFTIISAGYSVDGTKEEVAVLISQTEGIYVSVSSPAALEVSVIPATTSWTGVELQNAINAAGTTPTVIEINDTITYTSTINIPTGADITLRGRGTLNFDGGNASGRAIVVNNGAKLTIDGITVTRPDERIASWDSRVGGIAVTGGNLIMIDGVITGANTAGSGGTSPSAGPGGGVRIMRGGTNGGSFTMYGGTISNNFGSGVSIQGDDSEFIMRGGYIENNRGGWAAGGGVFLASESTFGPATGSPTFRMYGGTIRNNSAWNSGAGAVNAGAGGVDVARGTFIMSGGRITGNVTSQYYCNECCGGTHENMTGGVRVGGAGTFNMTGGYIYNNTTDLQGYDDGNYVLVGEPEIDNIIVAPGGIFSNDGGYIQAPDAEITTIEQLLAAIAAAGTTPTVIEINSTITYTSQINIPTGANITLRGSGTLNFDGRDERAIVVNNGASLTIDGITVARSDEGIASWERGGGIAVTGGNLIMIDGVITGGNTAGSGGTFPASGPGGGVRIMRGGTNGGSFTMYGGTISNNFGSGVSIQGDDSEFIMRGGYIENNRSSFSGGGVYLASVSISAPATGSPTFRMYGGTIRNNSARNSGAGAGNRGAGGIEVRIGTFTMSGGRITDNVTTSSYCDECCGGTLENMTGGVRVGIVGTFNMTGGYIYNNTTELRQEVWNEDEWYEVLIGEPEIHNILVVSGGIFNHDGGYIQAPDAEITTIEQLLAAIAAAGTTPTVIEFNSTITHTSQISIPSDADITLRGSGTLVLGGTGRSLSANNGATLTIDGITVTRANPASQGIGGGINVNNGNLTMIDGTITGNRSSFGIVNVTNGGRFTMYGGTISDNHDNGVGVRGDGSEFIMRGGYIEDNTNLWNAGGVLLESTTTSAPVGSPTFRMYGGTIRNNTNRSMIGAGGVNVTVGTFTMLGGSITDNLSWVLYCYECCGEPEYLVGGVRVGSYGTFNMSGGYIYSNTSEVWDWGWDGSHIISGPDITNVLVVSGGIFNHDGGYIEGISDQNGNEYDCEHCNDTGCEHCEPGIGDEPTLIVSPASGNAGSRISADIRLANNPGFMAMVVKVEIPEELTLVGYRIRNPQFYVGFTGFDTNAVGANITTGADLNISDEFYFGWLTSPSEQIATDETLITLIFEVCATAEYGETFPITASFTNAQGTGADTPSNADNEYVHFQILQGRITVANYMRGDVRGIGRITSLDAALIARYLAGHNVEINRWAADLDGDGIITPADVTLLMSWLVGHDVTIAH